MATSTRSLVRNLAVIAILMFGFTFALIPLYNVFCQVTGLNGKVDLKLSEQKNPEIFARYKIDNPNNTGNAEKQRRVIVEFDTNRNQHLLCEFKPEHTVLQVIPGELTHTSYYVKNLTQKRMTIQAIPSISPGQVAKHLKKLECFCFNQQTLEPGQAMQLPLRFWLEPEFPKDIHRLTLSYTLFDVTSRVKENGT